MRAIPVHRRVLRCLGASVDPQTRRLCLFLELAEGGTLGHLVRNNGMVMQQLARWQGPGRMTATDRIAVAQPYVHGMDYCHQGMHFGSSRHDCWLFDSLYPEQCYRRWRVDKFMSQRAPREPQARSPHCTPAPLHSPAGATWALCRRYPSPQGRDMGALQAQRAASRTSNIRYAPSRHSGGAPPPPPPRAGGGSGSDEGAAEGDGGAADDADLPPALKRARRRERPAAAAAGGDAPGDAHDGPTIRGSGASVDSRTGEKRVKLHRLPAHGDQRQERGGIAVVDVAANAAQFGCRSDPGYTLRQG
eukprot:gene21349-22108_t